MVQMVLRRSTGSLDKERNSTAEWPVMYPAWDLSAAAKSAS